jgi:hypothetical protein
MSVYTLLSCASSRIMTEYLDSKKSCKILLEIMTHKHTLDTITKFHNNKNITLNILHSRGKTPTNPLTQSDFIADTTLYIEL